MKIVHICLAAFYVEGWGYQENLLPKHHIQMGHTVTVITSDFVFNNKSEAGIREKTEYVNDFGVKVRTVKRYPKKSTLYNIYHDFIGLYEMIEEEKPDLIFVHGGQFASLSKVVKYCRQHKGVKLCIDQHLDYYNYKLNSIKRKLLHRYVYGSNMRAAAKLGARFYGVTPWRCEYLRDVYKIPEKNISLLVMGGDDEYIKLDQQKEIRSKIRTDLNISQTDFVVISGGKIDANKNFGALMRAIREIDKPDLKLILFGQPDTEMERIINDLAQARCIRFIGWQDSAAVYDYFQASDLACFPGTHSVLWEQACACGIPGIYKDWYGMHHIDVGGNVCLISDTSVEGIKGKISELYNDKEKYAEMKKVAVKKGVATFSYRNIAQRSIDF